MNQNPLGWPGVLRLGLIQAALGSIVVLAISTMNRVMVVELALPAFVPGALVAIHYLVQILRPRLGFGSDVGGRRTPWIVGGMVALAMGGVGAAAAIGVMSSHRYLGLVAAVLAFTLIGIGVGACGTSLLVLLAKRVDERRRAAAATIVWVMMIAGFVVTTIIAGKLLEPYSAGRLIAIVAAVGLIAVVLTLLAVRNVEGPSEAATQAASGDSHAPARPRFREALMQVWAEPKARRFTIFVFVSMLAYSGQELILDPFAGSVFGFTPGQSTQLSGVQHGGALLGMILVALAGSAFGGRRYGSLQAWTVGGCVASAIALINLAAAGFAGPPWPLKLSVFALGVANGAFAVAAIGSMMSFVGEGRASREGVRMGLWGAAQAVAFGLGGFLGAAATDLTRYLLGAAGPAYALVFAGEAIIFLYSAALASRLGSARLSAASRTMAATDGAVNFEGR